MRKNDDKVRNKTHGYTKIEGGQRKKEREKALKDRNIGGKKKKKKKEVVSLHPISRKKYALITANEDVYLSYINSNFFWTIVSREKNTVEI